MSAARAVRAAGVLVAALLAVGCGVDTDSEPRLIPRENVPEALTGDSTTTTASATGERPGQPVDVFFARAYDDQYRLVTLPRTVPRPATVAGVLDALLHSPPAGQEHDSGTITAVPLTTSLSAEPQREDGGVWVIHLNNGLFGVEGETLRMAYGQLVCTVTSLDDATGVLFVVGGNPRAAINGSGQEVTGPVTCSDYDELRAP